MSYALTHSRLLDGSGSGGLFTDLRQFLGGDGVDAEALQVLADHQGHDVPEGQV